MKRAYALLAMAVASAGLAVGVINHDRLLAAALAVMFLIFTTQGISLVLRNTTSSSTRSLSDDPECYDDHGRRV